MHLAVETVAKKLGLEGDINRIIRKLNENWVFDATSWLLLSPEKRDKLGFAPALCKELTLLAEQAEAKTDLCFPIVRSSKLLSSNWEDHLAELDFNEPLSQTSFSFLRKGSSDPVGFVLVPGFSFQHINQSFVCKSFHPRAAVEEWLLSLGLLRYWPLFVQHGLEDFFLLPFFTPRALQHMGISDSQHLEIICGAIDALKKKQPFSLVSEWLQFAGVQHDPCALEAHAIDVNVLRMLKEKDFVELGVHDPAARKFLIAELEKYKKMSSIEETFFWLKANNFEKYSFHFARYNIPFYALPFVNLFIIDEMGLTNDDQLLFSLLQNLKKSPTYNIKALAFWLRDLGLEKYNLMLSNNQLVDLDSLAVLPVSRIPRLVNTAADAEVFATGVSELKEFQFYYSAITLLLDVLGMERYTELFASHGISIDVFPLLSDQHLFQIGITSKWEREKILTEIKRINKRLCLFEDEPVHAQAPYCPPAPVAKIKTKGKLTKPTAVISKKPAANPFHFLLSFVDEELYHSPKFNSSPVRQEPDYRRISAMPLKFPEDLELLEPHFTEMADSSIPASLFLPD